MLFHDDFQTAQICYRLFPLMLDTAAQHTDAVTLLTMDPPCPAEAQATELLCEHYGAAPNIVKIGKPMGSGCPVKAVVNDLHDRGIKQ